MKHSVWLLLLILSAQPALAAIYKWVDEDGRVHYSEQPPSTAMPATRMRLEKSPQNDPSAEAYSEQMRRRIETSNAQRDQQNEAAAQRQTEEKQAREREEQRKHNCTLAKSKLALYQNGGRIFHVDEKGERQYLSDQDRPAARQRAQDLVKKWCR